MYLYTGIEKQKTYTHIIYIYICYAMCVRQCVWTLCISITKCGHIESMSYCLHPRFLHERPVTLSKGSWPRISSRWVASWAVWWVIWPSFRTGRCHGWRMVKEKDRKEASPSAPKTIWAGESEWIEWTHVFWMYENILHEWVVVSQ